MEPTYNLESLFLSNTVIDIGATGMLDSFTLSIRVINIVMIGRVASVTLTTVLSAVGSASTLGRSCGCLWPAKLG
jgi:hypothetical protein